MATYKVEDSEFAKLKGKTILITGCSTGIGRSTVDLAFRTSFSIVTYVPPYLPKSLISVL